MLPLLPLHSLLRHLLLHISVKYLSQANVANGGSRSLKIHPSPERFLTLVCTPPWSAYVSGMQEDLGFKGTQYNTLLSMFVAGYTIGQFPVRSCLPCAASWTSLTDPCSHHRVRC